MFQAPVYTHKSSIYIVSNISYEHKPVLQDHLYEQMCADPTIFVHSLYMDYEITKHSKINNTMGNV